MDIKRIALPIVGAVIIAAAWNAYGWAGVAVAVSAMVMWTLLHFTRMMHVLKQASGRPVGYVASAVMFNARLKPKANMLHVLAMTRALGEQLSPKDQQPEVFRWTDPGGSSVTCEFANGRLVKWTLYRPPQADEAAAHSAGPAAPAEAAPRITGSPEHSEDER